MAKAPAKPDTTASATEQAAPKKSRKMLLIVLILLLIFLIILVGAVVLLLMLKNKDHTETSSAEAPAAVQQAYTAPVDLSKPPTFITLDPFTVNLRPDEGNHYLQAIIVMRVADAKTAENLKGFMPEIRHRINILLSSKLPSELADPEGREELAHTIVDQVNETLGFPPPRDKHALASGPIQAVLFNSFIVQ